MTIAVCSTQRSTLEQALAFIRYYQHLGATKIFIFLDDPDDTNYCAIGNIPGVVTTLCTTEYWKSTDGRSDSIEKRQMANAANALQLCREGNIDWLLHVDVDEFVYFDYAKNFNAYFGEIPKCIMIVRFPVCESIPTKEEHSDFLAEITQFRCHPISYRSEVKMRTSLKLKLKFNLTLVKFKKLLLVVSGSKKLLKYSYMKAHIAGKSATRVCGNIQKIGLHASRIYYKKGEHGTVAYDAAVLHFDAFSYDAWFKKWEKRVDGSGLSTMMHSERHQQLIDFQQYYLRQDIDSLRALYCETYFVSQRLFGVLKLLGLVKNVTLTHDF